jgi:HEAT repeat protein
MACDTQDASTLVNDRAEIDEGSADDQQVRDTLRSLQPRPTRAGHLRFTGPLVHDPRAAGIFIDRLSRNDEPATVRAALAEALPRTGGDFAEAAAALVRTDPDPTVRATLVEVMQRADAKHAMVAIRHGLADPDPMVRAAAARVAGMHDHGALLGEELVASLSDPDVTTRAWAARSVGVLRIEGAENVLVDALDHANADLRLHALRAIHRIDPERAATLPELPSLKADPDARVARLAAILAESR